MIRWQQFAEQAPEQASAGARLLELPAGVGVALLATVARDGRPRAAPVCPISCDRDLYLCIAARSPKHYDLSRDSRYVLHALLGENDEEFQVSGRAVAVKQADEEAAVHARIRFQFDPADPLIRLEIGSGLWVHWENPGQPGAKAHRRPWRAHG